MPILHFWPNNERAYINDVSTEEGLTKSRNTRRINRAVTRGLCFVGEIKGQHIFNIDCQPGPAGAHLVAAGVHVGPAATISVPGAAVAAVGEIIREALVVLPVVAEERFRDGPLDLGMKNIVNKV